jgi:hypothetical protein
MIAGVVPVLPENSQAPTVLSLAHDVLRAGCGIASRTACQTLPPVDSDPRTWQTARSGPPKVCAGVPARV